MPKKERVEIHRDADLASLDAELDDALDRLDQANQKIGEILQSFAPPQTPTPGKDTSPEQSTSIPHDPGRGRVEAPGDDPGKHASSAQS